MKTVVDCTPQVAKNVLDGNIVDSRRASTVLAQFKDAVVDIWTAGHCSKNNFANSLRVQETLFLLKFAAVIVEVRSGSRIKLLKILFVMMHRSHRRS